ncbi:phage tail assembly chaperone [Pseudomonas savastanoi]|uniref:Tail fiber assembly domain protein n=3 Tax=Pseudomonas savastanoi TaxID=29438 RepID=A0A0P9QND4_PSESG|nr:phage tail assembly chaperone [Pseudomonas savastanoi]KPB79417.1 Tail fiber assembly domain protein [Pseudomonas syringae pv. maculicola]EFW81978.1 tail fiber assembly domain protein [Pseudomonas savastanoi pv. glycinea str. B076]EFW87952.1 tail fiber assembly domain protein [Pseudomonas savastanoi pv. glycinea str. race 4]EGH16295.1 tail fiber assembly domain-containing protein [Pseudomonas savastanoi pv. glycinea str. race 4]KPB33170.1 Tail fiber assembly domain protein [Pseudomonas savas
MAVLKSARNPRWNVEHNVVTLDVIFVETEDTLGEIPFAASPDDIVAHGREIYQLAVAGEFGDIGEPTELEIQASVNLKRGSASALATAKINALQMTLEIIHDAVELNKANDQQVASIAGLEAEFNAWRAYRVSLAQIESQTGFPLSVEWPDPPAQPFIFTPPSEPDAQKTMAG